MPSISKENGSISSKNETHNIRIFILMMEKNKGLVDGSVSNIGNDNCGKIWVMIFDYHTLI